MILTPEQVDKLNEAAKPLVKFLCDNCHPHVYVIVDQGIAELVESVCLIKVDEFIKD